MISKWTASVALALALASPLKAERSVVPEAGHPANASATKARDINGFALGMTLDQLGQRVRLERIGADDYRASDHGVDYDFGLTPAGHVDRVTATFPVGTFHVDEPFITGLFAKLSAKYGAPEGRPSTAMQWDLVQKVRDDEGMVLPFTTMWMSAVVTNELDHVVLTLTMVDYRIGWADKARLNEAPRKAASNSLHF